MNPIPFQRFTLVSPLTLEQVRQRLRDNVEPRKNIRWPNTSVKPYEGEVLENSFHLRRIINYRNSFNPEIYGEMHRVLNRIEIKITMRLHYLVALFMAVWLGGVATSLVAMKTSRHLPLEKFGPEVFLPIGMLVFGVLLTSGGFAFEARRCRKDLEKLLLEPPLKKPL